MQDLIESAAASLIEARYAIALTGAGISVESGIPPFRGKGGLWEKFDPMEFAHIDAFMRDPAKVWQVLISEMKTVVDRARPNDAHLGLAELERMGIIKGIITQNVDGLHQMAGNRSVVEFHGSFAWQRCLDCNGRLETAAVSLKQMPPLCACGGIYRPECIFFGEMIPPQDLFRSKQMAAACDVMLVMGTSAEVQPAAYMPVIARRNGAKVIEINPSRTLLSREVSNYLIQGPAGAIMRELLAAVQRQKAAV